jgi:hypothetical protein
MALIEGIPAPLTPAAATKVLVLRNYVVYKGAWKLFITGFLEPVFYLFSIGIGVGQLIDTFEFHGEEGFADVVSSSPREYTRFFLDLVCAAAGGGELTGPGQPGARLRVRAGSGVERLSLQANKNRPGAGVSFEAEVHEKRRGIAIQRSTTIHAGSAAFYYDPLLRTATITPPAPFSGYGSFRRSAKPVNRWTGNLTLDFPGRSDVPLTGGDARAFLVPARLIRE